MNSTKPLTVTEVNELGGAIQELVALNSKSIIEKDDAARKRALTAFIQEKMTLHCQEFISAWFVLEQEYKPFLAAQATVMGNVFLIIQRRQQIQDAAKQQTETTKCECADPASCPCKSDQCECTQAAQPTPANVVQLNTTTTAK
jgi:hypothetical protein